MYHRRHCQIANESCRVKRYNVCLFQLFLVFVKKVVEFFKFHWNIYFIG